MFDGLKNTALARALFGGSDEKKPPQDRWVVVDIETTGLDHSIHSVLSIGAVALVNGQVNVNDSFEAFLKQTEASASSNILIHGISTQQQLNGSDPRVAFTAFLDYVGTSPLMGFQSSFDRGFLARAAKVWAQAPLGSDWLDVAELARMAYPETKARALDDWLAALQIENLQRHSAIFDALATAMLLQTLLKKLQQTNKTDFRSLQALAAQAKFVPRPL
jgi:DNA polymerase III subunit epsilon